MKRVKGTIKLSLSLPKMARGEAGLVPRIMNLCSRWKCVANFMTRPLYPQTAETLVRIEREAGWPHSQSRRFREGKKSRTPANQTTIPPSSNMLSFQTSTEISSFLILSFLYLLIVGMVGYFCIWSLSMTHTYTHTHTLGRTPLDEGSARRRDLYLTTQDTHKKQTAMRPAGLELAIPAGERPQTHVLDGAAILIGYKDIRATSSKRPRYDFHPCHTEMNHQLWFKNVFYVYLCQYTSYRLFPLLSGFTI